MLLLTLLSCAADATTPQARTMATPAAPTPGPLTVLDAFPPPPGTTWRKNRWQMKDRSMGTRTIS